MMVVQLCRFAETHQTAHLKRMNFMVCLSKAYLNEPMGKKYGAFLYDVFSTSTIRQFFQ